MKRLRNLARTSSVVGASTAGIVVLSSAAFAAPATMTFAAPVMPKAGYKLNPNNSTVPLSVSILQATAGDVVATSVRFSYAPLAGYAYGPSYSDYTKALAAPYAVIGTAAVAPTTQLSWAPTKSGNYVVLVELLSADNTVLSSSVDRVSLHLKVDKNGTTHIHTSKQKTKQKHE